MTTAELVKAAAGIIPTRGATRAVAVVDHQPGEKLADGRPSGRGGRTIYRAAFFDGLRTSAPVGPEFTKPRDLHAFLAYLNGDRSTPRSARPDPAGLGIDGRDAGAPSEAPIVADPVAAAAASSRCVVCDGPLPPGLVAIDAPASPPAESRSTALRRTPRRRTLTAERAM